MPLANLIVPLLSIVALVVIGVVFGPRAGAGRGRLGAALILLVVVQLLSGGFAVALPFLAHEAESVASVGLISGLFTLLTSIGFVAAVALLASAVALAARHPGGLDLSNPGAPPSGYTGTGYPPAGGGSPYVNPSGPDGGSRP